MVTERRNHSRSRSIFDLKVMDRDTLVVIGYLLDLSSGGLGVISDDPIGTHQVFRLKLLVPLEDNLQETIIFDAESVWCQKAPEAELYHTGFQFMELSRTANESLGTLLRDDFLMTGVGTW